LWTIHRLEVAASRRIQPVTAINPDIFVDYLERADMGGDEDLGDLRGFTVTTPRKTPETFEHPTLYYTTVQKDLVTNILREVLDDLRQRDEQKARERRHDRPLREFRTSHRRSA